MIEPSYDHAGVTLYTGDSLAVLRELPDGCAQMALTSPPFFGLRDYGTATWEGGDAGCAHRVRDARTVSGGAGKQYTNEGSNRVFSGDCLCGARRIDQQLGLEADPADYLSALLAVFREVRRVLRPDGTLWVEIGDSYAGAGYSNHANTGGAQRADGGKQRHTRPGNPSKTQGAANRDGLGAVAGYKPKDLMLMPFELARALRDDGWYLRAPIIWHKPAAMPESVRDRVTIAHSYVWMLAKSERYYYDHRAVAEPGTSDHGSGNGYKRPAQISRGGRGSDTPYEPCATRNARSVWSITHEGFDGAHFATMPRELARRCILAGSAPGDTVIDPFSGAGTTALVAKTLGRQAIGIELNPAYVELARKRVEEPLFETATEEAPRAAEQAALL